MKTVEKEEKSTNATAADAANGKSVVTSFRYYKGMCFATLKNGVSGVVGDTLSCGLRDMIALKGSGIQILYTTNGTWTDDKGAVHPRYRLEWSLE